MKTTLELPDDLLRAMKMQAVQEGRKFKDVAEEIFRRGLAQPVRPSSQPLRQRVKLPLIVAPPGAPIFSLTGKDIDRLLMEDEVQQHHATAGH